MTSRATSVVHPPPHIKSNTGLRGVAALLVVAYHLQFAGYRLPIKAIAGVFDRGYLMVDLFFILSGFILSYVNSSKMYYSCADYKSFMVVRFIRIYPLHIFCLIYLFVVTGSADAFLIFYQHRAVFADWSPSSLILLLSQITLTNGWFFTDNGWNTPTWSISVEVLAYAAFPFLMFSLARFRAAAAVILLASASFYAVIAQSSGNLDIIGGIAILRCLAGFCLGMLISEKKYLVARISSKNLSIIQLLTIVGFWIFIKNELNDCLIIPVFCVMVFVTSNDLGVFSKFIATYPFQFLGKISYSIYLNHVCLLIILQPIWTRLVAAASRHIYIDNLWFFPIFFVVVIIFSVTTYRHVELPIGRFLNGRLQARKLGLAISPSAL